MLKKYLYLYAMMIFCFTALQAADEIPTGQTVVKCPHCPRHLLPNNEESNLIVIEDDNAEIESEAGSLFSVAAEDENNPHALNQALSCNGKRNCKKCAPRNEISQILVCNEDEIEESIVFPALA